VDVFSGGERARLALALIAWRKPNVLLLDEPTNHLDLDMREALAEALADFDGAIVLVSHDRHLIGLVSETFWRVADGRVDSFAGDLDEYAAWLGARTGKSAVTGAAPAGQPAPVKTVTGPAGRTRPDARAVRGQQQQLGRLEQQMAELAGELARLEVQLAEPATYATEPGRLAELAGCHAAAKEAHEALENQWLALYGDPLPP
jgi:ATP-binding cassette subfamily F protein 3